ncbi:hypothetical protein Vi05172_g10498 [Venturia inaequalis]|nr:hypothetical protein Vi05172_g10498 [Venturia inaequalis]
MGTDIASLVTATARLVAVETPLSSPTPWTLSNTQPWTTSTTYTTQPAASHTRFISALKSTSQPDAGIQLQGLTGPEIGAILVAILGFIFLLCILWCCRGATGHRKTSPWPFNSPTSSILSFPGPGQPRSRRLFPNPPGPPYRPGRPHPPSPPPLRPHRPGSPPPQPPNPPIHEPAPVFIERAWPAPEDPNGTDNEDSLSPPPSLMPTIQPPLRSTVWVGPTFGRQHGDMDLRVPILVSEIGFVLLLALY